MLSATYSPEDNKLRLYATGRRRRRIKRLESERKKAVRNRDKSQRLIEVWTKDGLTLERAKYITNYFDDTYHCFPLSEFPRETSKYEGMTSLWSALDEGIINDDGSSTIRIDWPTSMQCWTSTGVIHEYL